MDHQVRSVIPAHMTLHHPLWRFSLSVYARPGVRDALLAAQAQRQIWINDWLFALWAGAQGNTLRPEFAAAVAARTVWRQAAVGRWRKARQALKACSAPLYAQFKQGEIALEQADQAWLYAQRAHLQSAGRCPPAQALRDNLCQVNGGFGPAESVVLSAAALSVMSLADASDASRRR